MFIVGVGSGCRGIESVEDQVSTDIGHVIQVPNPDLTARGVAVDLLQMAKRVGPQCKAAEHEDLSGEEGFPWTTSLFMIEGAINLLRMTQWNSQ